MEDIQVATPRTQVSDEFRGERKITERQRTYLLDLIRRKHVKPDQEGKVDLIMKCLRISEDPEEFGMSMAKASELITWFERRDDKPRDGSDHRSTMATNARQTGLPDGYYAVKDVPGHSNETSFFRLRSPKNGRWVGWQFLDQVVGHGKRYPVRDEARVKVVELIKEQDPVKCQQLYGQEIGACGRCGRELTDDTSRQRGIGPDCWGKMGF